MAICKNSKDQSGLPIDLNQTKDRSVREQLGNRHNPPAWRACLVFQAEIIAIQCCVKTLLERNYSKKEINIVRDSQAVLRALDSSVNNSRVVIECIEDLMILCLIPGLEDPLTANYSAPLLDAHIPRLPSGEIDSCHLLTENLTLIPCTEYVYDTTYYGATRAVEWNLVCDRRWVGAVAQCIFMFGVFTGALTLGNAADKYGRKTIFCWSALLQLIVGVAVAFTPDIYSFAVLRFILGIVGSAGSYITGFVLTMEIVGPSMRTMCGISFQAVFACGIMLVAGWASFIRDPMYLQIVYGLHALLLAGHWWLMDESPRWLWAQGRTRESVMIIKKGLKMNNSPIHIDESAYISETKVADESENEASVLDLFKTPNLRKKTLNMCLCWFANSLLYYGLSLNTGKMNGNPFLILFLMGLVELPSYVLTVAVVDRTGRRSLMSFYMVVGGVCCIVATLLTAGSTEATTIVMIGKFLIASSFAIVYNYSAELFPTVVRNSAIGIFSMCARLSGALTPLITLLDSFDPKLPSNIFAVIALFSGFLTLFLPETLGHPMPQSIEDGEKFGVGDTCFTTCLGRRPHKSRAASKEQMDELDPLQQK